MIRDSSTNTSLGSAYMDFNGGTSIIFMYRSVPGGPATTITIASNVSLPYWIVRKM